MKKWVIFVIIFVLVIIGVAVYALIKGGGSFGFSFSSAKITDAKSCVEIDEDKNPLGITSTFIPNSLKVSIWFSWGHAPISTEAKAVLIYETSDSTVTEVSVVLEDMAGIGSFLFTQPTTQAGWPLGDYRVDLYLDDKLSKTVNFEVLLPPEIASDCEKFTGDAKDQCYLLFA